MRELPALLGRFIPRDVLGEGAQGVVVRAFDPVLDVDVALKLLHPAVANEPDVIERLRREALLVRRVNHPAVARIHDVVEDAGRTFLVMDLAHGVPLSRLLSRGPLTPLTAVRVVRKAALGLAAAHRAGVVHRDVKPDNLVVDLDGGADAAGDRGVCLVDFGVARAQDLAPLTETGLVIGTRRYVAPEIWMGAPATSLSDVFSLGLVLYQCLTGRHPFEGTADAALQAEPPGAVSKTALPASLDALTLQTIAPLPRDRTPSADHLAAALARIEDELLSPTVPTATSATSATTPSTTPSTRVRPAGVLVGAAALAVIAAVTTTQMTTPTPIPTPIPTPTPATATATTTTAPPPATVVEPATARTEPAAAAPQATPTKPTEASDFERRRRRDEAALRATLTALGYAADHEPGAAALSAVRNAPDAAALRQATEAARAVLATLSPTAAAIDASLLKANQRYAVAEPAQQALMRPLMLQAAQELRAGRTRAAWQTLIAAHASLPTP